LQKSSKAPDYAQDEDDQRDDSAEYQSDLQSIRANRESEAKLETPIIRENAAIETDEEDDSDLEVADESTTPDSENASSGTARDA
jgi:hypothetical protein